MPMFRVSNYSDSDWFTRGSYTVEPGNEWTSNLPSPYLLMIHGYNNDTHDADLKFLPVSNQFNDLTRMGYYWENSREYLVGRKRSKRGAASLKRFLIDNFSPSQARQLTIVAHSMGCRLILDCLTRLANDPDAPIIKPKNLILWSAAVDDDEIIRGEPLYAGTRLPKKVWVMHSRRDAVLEKLYPLGDQARALGWHGPDLDEGPVGANVESVNCTSFIDDHSKWWKSPKALRTLRSLIDTGRLP